MQGPIGPTGATGATGATGPTGPTGSIGAVQIEHFSGPQIKLGNNTAVIGTCSNGAVAVAAGAGGSNGNNVLATYPSDTNGNAVTSGAPHTWTAIFSNGSNTDDLYLICG